MLSFVDVEATGAVRECAFIAPAKNYVPRGAIARRFINESEPRETGPCSSTSSVARLPFQALAGSAQKRKAAADQEPVCKQPRPDQPNPGQGTFRPFELKAGMTLAPAVPADVRQRFDHLLMDRFLQSQCTEDVRVNPRGERWHRYVREPRSAPRAKLLQFCENVRPAYWGTWRRRSRTVSGRNPWGKDQTLDYEVDSEAEWDEEPGESLSGSEPESEPDDYEVDNEVFVPHGYLSEDEEEGGGPSAAALQVRQLELQDELRESGPKGPRLQPLVVCGQDVGLLARFAAVRLKPGPLRPSWQEESLPNDALQLLGRLVHGRACCSQGELVRQFQSKWEGAPVARRQLLDALQALGPERPRGGNCWRLPAPSLLRLGMPLSRPAGPLDRLWSRETGSQATPVESRQ